MGPAAAGLWHARPGTWRHCGALGDTYDESSCECEPGGCECEPGGCGCDSACGGDCDANLYTAIVCANNNTDPDADIYACAATDTRGRASDATATTDQYQ